MPKRNVQSVANAAGASSDTEYAMSTERLATAWRNSRVFDRWRWRRLGPPDALRLPDERLQDLLREASATHEVAPVPPDPAVAPVAPTAPASDVSEEAALRMLAIAQKTAEDTIADAQREAGKMLREAEKVLGETRMHADRLERETQERHRNVVGNLDSERERLEGKIEELRSFERQYRARLKSYLEGQLRDLDGRAEVAQRTAPRQAGAPVTGRAPGVSASAGAAMPASRET